MNRNKTLPALLALCAAAFTLNASAQSANPTGPGNMAPNKAGETYPNDPNAANPGKPVAKTVTQARNSKAAKAARRTAKKARSVVADAGRGAADATRRTGNAIARKLPPAKGEKPTDAQGTPRVTP